MVSFISQKKGKLSKIVIKENNDISYSAVMKLLRGKDIKVNGKRINTDIEIDIGDKIELFYTTQSQQHYEIIYSDENILVVNKRSGITSEQLYNDIKKEYINARFIHRLDRNTDGLIVFALNDYSEKELLNGFKNRLFDKFYLAKVVGVPKIEKGEFDAYLFKDSDNAFVKISKTPINKYSVKIKTGYKLISTDGQTSLLEVKLFTGKTHQIRAHLAFLGLPIVGDGKYGDNSFNKSYGTKSQMLTAYKITFYFNKQSKLSYLNNKTFEIKKDFSK